MWKMVRWVLERFGLIKTKDKFVVVNGVKCRVVAEPYPPPKDK